ncbi:hypothetical protein Sj15T_00510 [Sphingobium sp. TA15]|uniref:Uncharacterized protein n=2 Tax=Sphingobium indicum TaxID=332055 RepID=D4YZC3_SPHIU|nr:hypothetical protein [Sphingobium indicum]KER35182.1 hypothetical protein AL00_17655 [Sphingobium indicum F2]BAI95705.1 hypothetical protein SJA_C1-08710 [Sphingobium indicum UT26S]BDD65030.1 hypothetical protein Sj15T_00510 [Sphingobium sp. TA15]
MTDPDFVKISMDKWMDLMKEYRSSNLGIAMVANPDEWLSKLIQEKLGVKPSHVEFGNDGFTIFTTSESDATAVRMWL